MTISADPTALGAGQTESSGATVSLGRMPAAAVIAEVLRLQEGAPLRTRLHRLTGRRPLVLEAAPWFAGAEGELEVA